MLKKIQQLLLPVIKEQVESLVGKLFSPRLAQLEKRLDEIGFDMLRGRMDFRLIRLEMLQYYQDKERYGRLDPEARRILAWMQEDFFAVHANTNRVYPLTPAEGAVPEQPQPFALKVSPQGTYYVESNGVPVHLADNEKHAAAYWYSILAQEAPGSPHLYIDENEESFGFPDNAVLADVGGAEGFFTAKYIHKISKAYIFESDPHWLAMLGKTFAAYADKVEIVEGMVGDKPGEIVLDAFFKDRPKPTFVKMDVEGSEERVLRGMDAMLRDDRLPMQLAVCLYHRQEDETLFTAMLREHFSISYSTGYYWHMPDPRPPFFRRGVLRAKRR